MFTTCLSLLLSHSSHLFGLFILNLYSFYQINLYCIVVIFMLTSRNSYANIAQQKKRITKWKYTRNAIVPLALDAFFRHSK